MNRGLDVLASAVGTGVHVGAAMTSKTTPLVIEYEAGLSSWLIQAAGR